MSVSDGECPSLRKMVLWGLRHPIKGLLILIVAAIGEALSYDVDWTITEVQVKTGQTARDHCLAEGYDV